MKARMDRIFDNVNYTEELIKEYMINGGEVWKITDIDTYRDGGTKVLQTTIPNNALKYYIHNKNWTLHYNYPPDISNIITDKPTIAYVMYRIDKYKESIEYKMHEVLTIQDNFSIEGTRNRKINEILDK